MNERKFKEIQEKIRENMLTLKLVKGDEYSMAVGMLAQYLVVHAALTGILKEQAIEVDTFLAATFSCLLKKDMEGLVKDGMSLAQVLLS